MSKKKLLLASQRIEVGALLHGTTLNTRAFRWGVADSETTTGAQVTRLEYANGSTPAYFQFDHYLHKHYALYSWGDGVVWPPACIVDYARNVRVPGSHVGLAFNRHAYRIIARTLAPKHSDS